jgi:hypothetical protein
VAFGLSRTPARLTGFVRDDAGRPIGGVAVRLEGETRKAAAITDSSGRFMVATAEGDYIATLAGESIPAGYDATSVRPTTVYLRRGEAERLLLVVNAHRAVSGRVLGSGVSNMQVRLVELGRAVPVGSDGGYTFRNLKPGRHTVSVTADGRTLEREVLVPEGPALIRDVDLDLSPPPGPAR